MLALLANSQNHMDTNSLVHLSSVVHTIHRILCCCVLQLVGGGGIESAEAPHPFQVQEPARIKLAGTTLFSDAKSLSK